MTPVGWLALGVGLALLRPCVPGRRRAGGRTRHRARETGPSARPALVRGIAAVAPAVGAAGLVGPVRGLLVGAAVAPVVVLVLARAQARAGPVAGDPRLPFCLDLVAAGLRGGRPVGAALAAAAPAASPPVASELERVAGLLRLGADPAEAWRSVSAHPTLEPVARAACRSAHSGARLACTLEALADDLRACDDAHAVARAHRAGIRAMAPLGACFLPGFLCLGVVPVVIGVARGAFAALP